MIRAVLTRAGQEPVLWYGFLAALLAVPPTFPGLPITEEQLAAITAVVLAGGALAVRQKVTPWPLRTPAAVGVVEAVAAERQAPTDGPEHRAEQ